MNRRRLLLAVLLLLPTLPVGYLLLSSLGMLATPHEYREVPAGCHEVVFLFPATSSDAWQRFVAALDALHAESQKTTGKPRLHMDKSRAVVALTADVPEVELWIDGCEDARLLIRWYKLSGKNTESDWMQRFNERGQPPLAIIAGDTSYRAVKLARELTKWRSTWNDRAPLLLITTATADRIIPEGADSSYDSTHRRWPELMSLYGGRTFRFAFSNTRMAEAVLGFVGSHDELWPHAVAPAYEAAALAGAGQPLQAANVAVAAHAGPHWTLHNMWWEDDSYSRNLADLFALYFRAPAFRGPQLIPWSVAYSSGDFYQPNPSETTNINRMVQEMKRLRDQRQLLLLPTGTEPARRVLRALCRQLTRQDAKNLVVITGDSIGFNTIYRDREAAWNIHDLPLPLVVFSHRDPTDARVGFRQLGDKVPLADSTGTVDLLLYRDILEALLSGAYRGGRLVASADELLKGLDHLVWRDGHVQAAADRATAVNNGAKPLFSSKGNRHRQTGEHVIVLWPHSSDDGLAGAARIAVWKLHGPPPLRASWSQTEAPLVVTYNR